MKPNGAVTALARQARLALSTIAALLALASPSLAGDRAGIDFIGYSADGGFFAFEEFGIQDGSGFAYSNIYVIDLAADKWVAGTPVRVAADSEEQRLSAVRSKAAADASAALQDLAITEPVTIAALIGDGVPDESAKTLAFGAPSYKAGEIMERYELELSQFQTKSPLTCAEWFGAEPLGYALSLSGSGEVRELHKDQSLPQSRGCPLDYRLYGVVLPFDAGTIENGVAIVSVYPGGFEGPDRRFVAVPLAP